MKTTANKDLFEYNVLILGCTLGLIRSLIAISGDLVNISENDDFITDILFAIIFLFAVIGLRLAPYKWILFLFYAPFITLLLITFIRSGGLTGGIEHNILAGLILVALTLRGRGPVYFVIVLIFGTILSLIYLEWKYGFLENFEDQHINSFNFIFSSLGIIGFTYYAKNVFSIKRKTLEKNREALKNKSLELTRKTDELLEQKEALETLTLALNNKVKSRTRAIKYQKKRREKYLSITLNELSASSKETLSIINDMKKDQDNDQIIQMLIQSGDNLQREMIELNKKLNVND